MKGKVIERLGVFGGSFNPIHAGHIEAARVFQRQFDLSELMLVPTNHPFYKTTCSVSYEDRLAMCEAAAGKLPKTSVCDLERSHPEGMYAFDLLQILTDRHPQSRLFYLVGGDVFLTMPHWYAIERFADLTEVVVIHRPSVGGLPDDPRIDAALHALTGLGIAVHFLDAVRPLSSTQIREALDQGRSIDGMVPTEVEDYIRLHGLYATVNRNEALRARISSAFGQLDSTLGFAV